jgi:hypothetical protein
MLPSAESLRIVWPSCGLKLASRALKHAFQVANFLNFNLYLAVNTGSLLYIQRSFNAV